MGNLSKTIQKFISKDLKVETKENLIEFYNNAGESKVSKELLGILKPEFIFSTKEKTSHWISDGKVWVKDD